MNVYTKMLISIVFLYVINVKSNNKVIEILKWFYPILENKMDIGME